MTHTIHRNRRSICQLVVSRCVYTSTRQPRTRTRHPATRQVGLFSTGSAHGRIPTPHIDALFESGVRFTNAYAGAPVCAPSRNALLTGQHTGHTWIRGNVPYEGHDLPLRSQDVTLPMLLRDSGYRTALVGKWGLGYENSTGAAWAKGWETYFGQLDQSYCHK